MSNIEQIAGSAAPRNARRLEPSRPRRFQGLLAAAAFAALAGCHNSGNSTPAAHASLLDACPALPASTAQADSLAALIDAAAARKMKADGLPGMVVEIAKDGVVAYASAYGYADLKACVPAQVDTPYQMGSVTKQFTAAAILQLQNAGSLDIDKPAIAYLPAYAFDPRITLRMLLNQTSGLADYLGFPPPPGWLNGLSQQDVLNSIVQAPLQFTPGSAYQYSNSNYFVLGAVVEAVSGMSYASYLSARIFEPAALMHTSYQEPLHAALPYSYDNPAVSGTTGLAAGLVPDPSVYFSAGALWTTVGDLALWDAALRQGRIIPKALLKEMTSPPPNTPDFQNAGTPSYYAMGWVTANVPGHQMVWHNGETLAFSAFNGLFLDDGFSVTVLTNVDIQENTPLLEFGSSLIQAICTNATTAGPC